LGSITGKEGARDGESPQLRGGVVEENDLKGARVGQLDAVKKNLTKKVSLGGTFKKGTRK